jgi:type IV pilus assembly protein PilV
MFHRPIKVPFLQHQNGASLIEVLVAILLLSFGMLALGAMLSFAVQAPKLSGYRATASNLASSHVERIRANPQGFAKSDGSGGNYEASLHGSTNITYSSSVNCSYPTCAAATLAAKDIQDARIDIRRQLPVGDLIMKCSSTPCLKTSYGELWVVWQEPSTNALLSASSDNCPTEATTMYTNPSPRCLYIRFKIE